MAKPVRAITPISGPTFPAWTKKSDYYIPTADLTIGSTVTVDTLAGNDTIRPTGSLWLTNLGSLILGTGNDNINYADNLDANGSTHNTFGSIYNYGLVDAGSGDDTFRAFFIRNFDAGVIRLGDGNDYMNSTEFINESNVEGGAGNDIFRFNYYINIERAFINLGSGSDLFDSGSGTDTSVNYGTIIAGLDSEVAIDQITGLRYSNSEGVPTYLEGDGIENQGIYRFGGGNDICSGQGTRLGLGIKNLGEIYMESGDDLLTDMSADPGVAIQYNYLESYGGIFNTGTIDMGTGNDTIRAYTVSGSGRWLGGGGTDTISLGKDGIYVVEQIGGIFSVSTPDFSAGGTQPVLLSSFEQIGGWNTASNLALLAGTYTISSNGGTISFEA